LTARRAFCLHLQVIHATIRHLAPQLKSLVIKGSTGDHYPLPADATTTTLTRLTRLELIHPAQRLEQWLPPGLEVLVVPRCVGEGLRDISSHLGQLPARQLPAPPRQQVVPSMRAALPTHPQPCLATLWPTHPLPPNCLPAYLCPAAWAACRQSKAWCWGP